MSRNVALTAWLAIGLLATGLLASADPCVGNPVAVENCLAGSPPSEWDISGVGDLTGLDRPGSEIAAPLVVAQPSPAVASAATAPSRGKIGPARPGTSLSVSTTTPANGATGVALGTRATVTFSEAIDPATFSGTVNGAAIVPTQAVFGDGNTAVTIDFGEMAYSTLYQVVIDGTVQNVAHEPIGSSVSFSFTTLANATSKRPSSTIVVPQGTIQAGQAVTLTGQASGYVWQRDAGNPLALRHWDQSGNDTGDSRCCTRPPCTSATGSAATSSISTTRRILRPTTRTRR